MGPTAKMPMLFAPSKEGTQRLHVNHLMENNLYVNNWDST